MRSIQQLLRQPGKTLAGIVLVALSVAALCVCSSFAISSARMLESMDESFTSVALFSEDCHFERVAQNTVHRVKLPEGLSQWVEETAAEHPDVVELVADHGLASAYIPELTPDNYTKYYRELSLSINYNYGLWQMSGGQHYSCAMLEITLTEIGEPVEQTREYRTGLGEEDAASVTTGYSVELVGVLERPIALLEGYPDPEGFFVRMTLELPTLCAFEELGLTVGERYLVYGIDYYDFDWEVRNANAEENGLVDEFLPPFDPDHFHYMTEEQIESTKSMSSDLGLLYYDVAWYEKDGVYIAFSNMEVGWFRSIRLTLSDKSVMPQYTWEEGPLGEVPIPVLEASYIGPDGEQVAVSWAEYQERYATPTIARLEGTAEEFLASEEGALWRETLDYIAVNNQAFAVIGVDDLEYVADFALERAKIVQGRDFTQEELDSGARVCILSAHLAELNGLSVGDTITPQFYDYDFSVPDQIYLSTGKGTLDPNPYLYGRTTPFVGEGVGYVIVGLYEPGVLWQHPIYDLYTFTPNTIFVPKTSVPSTMDYADQAFFRTIVVKNGALTEFDKLASAAGYGTYFVYHDQGWSVVSDSLYSHAETSRQIMLMGAALYAVLLLLFLFLFPARHGNALATMGGLGAERGRKYGHVVVSTLGILIPGTVIGTAAGILLWQSVIDALMSSEMVILEIGLNAAELLLVAAAQLAAALCVTLLLAIPLTREKSLMKRK